MDNFEYTATEAARLLKEQGLILWHFEFDNSRTRGGACHYSSRTITMSRKLVPMWSREEILDTLIHEVAHALTPGHSHDAKWRRVAIELGGSGKRTHDSATIEGRYKAICPTHGVIGTRHALQKSMRVNAACKRCGQSVKWNDTKATAPRMVAQKETPVKDEFGPICNCGCGQRTRGGNFLPGHDAKLLSVIRMDITLAWHDHVGRSIEGVETVDFKNALRAGFARIPAENSKLANKLSAWIAAQQNWQGYLTRMENR